MYVGHLRLVDSAILGLLLSSCQCPYGSFEVKKIFMNSYFSISAEEQLQYSGRAKV